MICFKLEKFVVFIYMWLWWSTSSGIHVKAANDHSLKPGDTLNATTKLCSKQGTFCMSFSQVPSHTNHTYLLIYVGGKDGYVVWIANGNQPVDLNSAVLSLNRSGVLKIESKNRDPMILYSSPQPVLSKSTIVATLLDTGNFVVQQLHPNGVNTVLWQSFDYPTSTLIPRMKLGVNHKTGHKWSLVALVAKENPSPGPFRLEWEPRTRELVIKHREQVYWKNGELRNNRFKHIYSSTEFQYEIVSNKDEEYFTLNTTSDHQELITIWALLPTGQLISRIGKDIARADFCYGYNANGGCQKWEEIPTCRSRGDVFDSRTGYPNYKMADYQTNGSYSISNCRAICWTVGATAAALDSNPSMMVLVVRCFYQWKILILQMVVKTFTC